MHSALNKNGLEFQSSSCDVVGWCSVCISPMSGLNEVAETESAGSGKMSAPGHTFL